MDGVIFVWKKTLIIMTCFLLYLTIGQVSAQNTLSQNFRPGPGSPWAAPSRQRWIPGHFEVIDGRQIWIRGQYGKVEANTSTASTPSPGNTQAPQQDTSTTRSAKGFMRRSPAPVPQSSSNTQQNTGTAPTNQGFVRPFSEGQAGSAIKWVPGHFEELNGRKIWMRGQYADEQATSAGPLADQLNPPATTETTLADKTKPVAKTQGWAVVIGISNYKYAAGKFPEVRYAANDAEEFYKFLRSPQGGGLPPDHILFLQNKDASLQNIKYAFFDFLKQALEEDYVIVYFSGHGMPEDDNPNNLYFLAYDSRSDRIASTAFPMWDIETALSRYIKSEKVIMFADACHSAGISGDISTRSSTSHKNMTNKFLLEVAKAKKGRAIFTASEAGELSQESRKWGGGHGVFTYFLLRALKGEADLNDNRIITLGETIDYVSEHVRRETNNTQHPDTAGIFDREFPVAVISH